MPKHTKALGSELDDQLGRDHSYTSCSDDDLCNAGYNLCRRCTELKLEERDRFKDALERIMNHQHTNPPAVMIADHALHPIA